MATTYPFVELPDPPKEGITCVKFSPNGQSLLVSSWDKAVYFFMRAGGPDADFILQEKYEVGVPILGACWGPDDNTSFLAVSSGALIMHVEGLDDVILSKHSKPSSCVAYSPELDIVLSASWDATLHVHDPESKKYIRIQLPKKVYSLSLSADRAVVSMAERHLWVFELRDLKALIEQDGGTADNQPVRELKPWQQRESNLKFMMRDVACMPDGEGFATSSIDGRVSVEWFDPARDDEKYAFKCHRHTEEDLDPDSLELREVDMIYPVNAVIFNRAHGTFATGGGDGIVILWDAKTKRRIRAYPKLPACVAAMDYSPDGKYLAVGVNSGYEDGLEDEPTTDIGIHVRKLEENEAKGKASKKV